MKFIYNKAWPNKKFDEEVNPQHKNRSKRGKGVRTFFVVY